MITLLLCVHLKNVFFNLIYLEINSQIKVQDIISYFDEGGNIILIGDIDTSRSYRKLFYSLGVDLD